MINLGRTAGGGDQTRKAVDVSTHRRAWKQRAGVVVALVFGALLTVPAAPAFAENPGVQITSLQTETLSSGQSTPMKFTVTNNNETASVFSVNVDVFDGLRCQGQCRVPAQSIPAKGSAEFNVTLTADNLAPGANKSGQVRVSARAGGDQGGDSRNMTVNGPEAPQQPQTVKTVSGKVVNADGDPIEGALVMLRDSAGRTPHQHQRQRQLQLQRLRVQPDRTGPDRSRRLHRRRLAGRPVDKRECRPVGDRCPAQHPAEGVGEPERHPVGE
ncbi:hypothetical protein V2I01_14805 [Micromonospora sp. BRA006-A]|nr:hypothetical protein [Micromonospora sp. BRA006-A]